MPDIKTVQPERTNLIFYLKVYWVRCLSLFIHLFQWLPKVTTVNGGGEGDGYNNVVKCISGSKNVKCKVFAGYNVALVEEGDGYNVVGPEVVGGQVESHYHTIMLPFRPRLHPCNIPNIRNTPVQIQNTPPSGITLPYHNAKYLITKYQIKQSIIPEVPAKSHYQQSKNLIGIILGFLKI